MAIISKPAICESTEHLSSKRCMQCLVQAAEQVGVATKLCAKVAELIATSGKCTLKTGHKTPPASPHNNGTFLICSAPSSAETTYCLILINNLIFR